MTRVQISREKFYMVHGFVCSRAGSFIPQGLFEFAYQSSAPLIFLDLMQKAGVNMLINLLLF